MKTSLPLASVATTAFDVNHVRVPQTLLSLLVPRFVISLVFVAISDDRASRATLIDPDIDPRVNICASVIREVAYVSCLATTVSISDSCPAVGVVIIVSSGICFAIRLNGL